MPQINNNSGPSLLESRLAGGKSAAKNDVDVSGLLHHSDAARDSAVPSYSADDVPASKSDKKPRKEKEPKVKREKAPKVKAKKTRLSDRVSSAVDTDKQSTVDDDIDFDIDNELNDESYRLEVKTVRTGIIKARINKIAIIAMVLCCVYFAFLIYGVIGTHYVYDDTGAIVPEILSVDDLHVLDQYNSLSSYYIRTQVLYEDVLDLDYRLAMDASQGSVLAREYRSLLDTVSKLCTDISAAELDTAYEGILERMYNLVYTHIAVYLQNVAGALETNDAGKANEAVLGREVVKSEFRLLTQNMASLCESTKGARNAGIYAWDPDDYFNSKEDG